MANMSPKKNPIPEQDPNVRNKNFEEVALGYTVEMAVDEANRCLNCPRPACMSGCPVNVKIPQFIARVREQDFKGAYHKILEDSSLPAICGRVCPQESQCEKDVMVDLARAQAHHALVDHAQQFDPPGGEQPADAVAVADVERVGRGEDFAFAHGGALAAVLGQRRGDGLKPFGEGFARVLHPDVRRRDAGILCTIIYWI